MRILVASLLMAFLFLGCSGRCRLSSDCDPGQHCNFTNGECLDGCRGDQDCSKVAVCQEGRCRPINQIMPDLDAGMDAGTSSTSSTADAG